MTRASAVVTWGMTWRRGRMGLSAMPIVVVACACLAAGCGGSGSATGGGTTTSDRTSLTTNSKQGAVLAAYRAGWQAFEQASATSNAADPALEATMVNPLLDQVRRNLTSDHYAGIIATGTYALHPRVTAITAGSATVVDCAYSTAKLVYQSTGKPVPPVTPPENDGVRSTLVLAGSTWKVSTQSVTNGSCSAGS